MAMLIRLYRQNWGSPRAHDLAEHCAGTRFSRPVVWRMWGLMEVVAMATDLAEFLGLAVGFYLFFGIPLWVGRPADCVATLPDPGASSIRISSAGSSHYSVGGVIAAGYLVRRARPAGMGASALSFCGPSFGAQSVLLAVGILGATVMPHVIFLHSSADTREGGGQKDPAQFATPVPVRDSRCRQLRWLMAGMMNAPC